MAGKKEPKVEDLETSQSIYIAKNEKALAGLAPCKECMGLHSRSTEGDGDRIQ